MKTFIILLLALITISCDMTTQEIVFIPETGRVVKITDYNNLYEVTDTIILSYSSRTHNYNVYGIYYKTVPKAYDYDYVQNAQSYKAFITYYKAIYLKR